MMNVQLFVVALPAKLGDRRPTVMTAGVDNSRVISAANISSQGGDQGANDCIVNGGDDVHVLEQPVESASNEDERYIPYS